MLDVENYKKNCYKSCHKLIFIRIKVRTISSRMAGRPNIRIDYIKARDLLRSQLSLGKVASALKMSTSTLRRTECLTYPFVVISGGKRRVKMRALYDGKKNEHTRASIISSVIKQSKSHMHSCHIMNNRCL